MCFNGLVDKVLPLAYFTYLTDALTVPVGIGLAQTGTIESLVGAYAVLKEYEVATLLLILLHAFLACNGIFLVQVAPVVSIVAYEAVFVGYKEAPSLKELAQVHLQNFAASLGKFQVVVYTVYRILEVSVFVFLIRRTYTPTNEAVVAKFLMQLLIEIGALACGVCIEEELEVHTCHTEEL